VRDIVIPVRSLSDRTTRSCVFSHSSIRTGCIVHIRYVRIKQRSFCTSRVRQRQLAPPAGNMRINRRKIYTRNANIRVRTRVLFGHNTALKACFSQACDHSVLSPANISTAKLIGFLSNQKPYHIFI